LCYEVVQLRDLLVLRLNYLCPGFPFLCNHLSCTSVSGFGVFNRLSLLALKNLNLTLQGLNLSVSLEKRRFCFFYASRFVLKPAFLF